MNFISLNWRGNWKKTARRAKLNLNKARSRQVPCTTRRFFHDSSRRNQEENMKYNHGWSEMRDLWKFHQLLYIIFLLFSPFLVLIIQEEAKGSCDACWRKKLYVILMIYGGVEMFSANPSLSAIAAQFYNFLKLHLWAQSHYCRKSCLRGNEKNFIMRHIYPLFRVHKFLIFHDVETWKGKKHKREICSSMNPNFFPKWTRDGGVLFKQGELSLCFHFPFAEWHGK